MTVLDIEFPRYVDDITSRRRTVLHLLVDDLLIHDEPAPAVGDTLRLIAHPDFPRCKVGTITDVRTVRLCEVIDADLDKIGCVDRDGYLASWDSLHPAAPAASDPMVWRIEFRYGIDGSSDPPEWSVAT